ncbi:tRNA pseudouridine synthase A [Proteus vulgaris]|nr:tRNA pseudouridine synthase A [Proteus vulgaris]
MNASVSAEVAEQSLTESTVLSGSTTIKIALGVEYDGSHYYGWQRQNEVRSVQERLEKALSQVANEPISVFCAGRTDAGVHATGQVVHFETTAHRKDPAWTMGVNTHLPADIAVRWGKNGCLMIFMRVLVQRQGVIVM